MKFDPQNHHRRSIRLTGYDYSQQINLLRDTEGQVVWQRNYYEHIIRSESEMDRITRYIESNPSMGWTTTKTRIMFVSRDLAAEEVAVSPLRIMPYNYSIVET